MNLAFPSRAQFFFTLSERMAQLSDGAMEHGINYKSSQSCQPCKGLDSDEVWKFHLHVKATGVKQVSVQAIARLESEHQALKYHLQRYDRILTDWF